MKNERSLRPRKAQGWLVRVLAVAVLALSTGLVGCSDIKQVIEDTERARTALKTELGVDSNVHFNWTNGRHIVSVRLGSVPAGQSNEVKRKVEDVVRRTFRAKVDRVDVTL
jgi:hypothetical protein